LQIPCIQIRLIRRVQLQTHGELATAQLVERCALARSERAKRVILGVCNIPIPGLPVSELVSWQEYSARRGSRRLLD